MEVCKDCNNEVQIGSWPSRSPTAQSWRAMRKRCLYAKHIHYNLYGGRGIKICARWLEAYSNFLEDMGERPAGTTLDRIDPNGNYTPENCRWATNYEQGMTKRTTKLHTIKDKTLSIRGWARELQIPRSTIQLRLSQGFSMGDICQQKYATSVEA